MLDFLSDSDDKLARHTFPLSDEMMYLRHISDQRIYILQMPLVEVLARAGSGGAPGKPAQD